MSYPNISNKPTTGCRVATPRASGLEVLRAMRATPGLADVPVVLMSPAVDRGAYR